MRLKKSDFPKHEPGEWVQPRRKYYLLGCCDCGLVHKMEFRLVPMRGGKKIQFRAWRDEKATKAVRRRDNHPVWDAAQKKEPRRCRVKKRPAKA